MAVYTNLSQCRLLLGDAARALEAADWALRVDPDLPKAHVRRGAALAALARWAEAEAAFLAARALLGAKKLLADVAAVDGHLGNLARARREAEADAAALAADDGPRGSMESCLAALGAGGDASAALAQFRALLATAELSKAQDLFRARGGLEATLDQWRAAGRSPALAPAAALLTLLTLAVKENAVSAAKVAMLDGFLSDLVATGLVVHAAGVLSFLRTVVAADAAAAASALFLGEKATAGKMLVQFARQPSSPAAFVVAAVDLLAQLAPVPRAASAIGCGVAEVVTIAVSVLTCVTFILWVVFFYSFIHPCSELLDGAWHPWASRGLVEPGSTEAMQVLALMLAMTYEAGARAVLVRDEKLLSGLLLPALRSAGSNLGWSNALLAVLANVSLESGAHAALREPLVLRTFAALLTVRSGDGASVTVARAATILARVGSAAAVQAELLAGGALAQFVSLAEAGSSSAPASDVISTAMCDGTTRAAVARALVQACQLGGADARAIVVCPGTARAAHAWLEESASPALAGNAALLLAELARDAQICAALAPTNIVARLLVRAKMDKSQEQENAAIALARLAQGHPVPCSEDGTGFLPTYALFVLVARRCICCSSGSCAAWRSSGPAQNSKSILYKVCFFPINKLAPTGAHA